MKTSDERKRWQERSAACALCRWYRDNDKGEGCGEHLAQLDEVERAENRATMTDREACLDCGRRYVGAECPCQALDQPTDLEERLERAMAEAPVRRLAFVFGSHGSWDCDHAWVPMNSDGKPGSLIAACEKCGAEQREPAALNEERIVAAAIRVGAEVWTLPPPTRHHTLIQAYAQAHYRDGKNGRVPEDHEQGFVTSSGRFVGREEAARIAHGAGQFEGKRARLYSEDVW